MNSSNSFSRVIFKPFVFLYIILNFHEPFAEAQAERLRQAESSQSRLKEEYPAQESSFGKTAFSE